MRGRILSLTLVVICAALLGSLEADAVARRGERAVNCNVPSLALDSRCSLSGAEQSGSGVYGVAWEAHDTPSEMVSGAAASVSLKFTNTGLLTWRAGEPILSG